jgi:general secretion pathway protein H
MIWRDEWRPPIAVAFRERQTGFTLIEVVVVMAILALALTLIVGYRPPWSSALSMRGAAGQLAVALRLARSEAISRDTPVSVMVDVARHRYRVDWETERTLPANLKVELLTLVSERSATNAGEIRFNPDGSSTGGRVTLADGSRTIAVGVDWLNGRVSIRDEP